MRSIRIRLLLIISALCLITVVALGAINYRLSYSAISKIVNSEVELVAGLGSRELSERILGYRLEMESLATTSEVRSMRWETQLPLLRTIADRSNRYMMMFVSDPSGAFKTTLGGSGNISARDYFPRIMAGATVVSDPVISQSTGKTTFVVGTPIKHGERIVGALLGSIEVTEVQSLLNIIKIGSSGYAFMVNKAGVVISHPQSELVLKTNILEDESLRELGKRVVSGVAGTTSYTYEGEKRIASYAPVPGTEWFIAVTVPETEVTDDIRSLGASAVVTGFISLLVAAIAAYVAAHFISGPIVSLTGKAEQLASGNLTTTVQVKGQDEVAALGRAFENMRQGLRDVVERIATASRDLDASSSQLARGAEESAASVEEVAKASGGFAHALSQLTDSTSQISSDSENVASLANTGRGQLDRVADSLRSVERQVTALADYVKRLAESNRHISTAVGSISEISDQTNLLALNAAIEAARAGEHGRGFAVVASEVRKLAELSSNSAKSVSTILREAEAVTLGAVKETGQAESEVSSAVKLVEETVASLQGVLSKVNSLDAQIRAVFSTVEELGASSEEIAASSEEQAASMQEISASVAILASMARELKKQTDRFKL